MDNRAVIERIMKNLAIEVETIPDNKTSSTSSKGDPLNVKIKVKKKEINEQHNQGFISNNQSQPEMVPRKVRVRSSDETIMSFDMFLEAEKEISHKPRKHVFNMLKPGICIGATTDEDNQPYMPDAAHTDKVSQDSQQGNSHEKLSHQFTLSKNNYLNLRKSPVKKERIGRTFLGRKCKPGGCLDPPFDEDIQSYEPVVEGSVLPDNADIMNHQEERPIKDVKAAIKSKRKSKDTSISMIPVDGKDGIISNISNMAAIRDSVITHPPEDNNQDIHSYKPVKETLSNNGCQEDRPINSNVNVKTTIKDRKKSKDTSFSINQVNKKTDSILTLLNMGLVKKYTNNNNKEIQTRVDTKDESRQLINDSTTAFFSPPKGIKRDSYKQIQRDSQKRDSYNPKPKKAVENLSPPIPITASLNSVPIEHKSASDVIGNVDTNCDIMHTDKQLMQTEPSLQGTDDQYNKPADIPLKAQKELSSDTDFSNLIGDTKITSVKPTINKMLYPKNYEEVTSSDINDPILMNAPDDIAMTLKKNCDPHKKQNVKNEIAGYTDESNINTEQLLPKTLDKVESFVAQTSVIKKEINLINDKVNKKAVERKDNKEQNINDTQISKLRTGSNVSSRIYPYYASDENKKKTSKDIIEILSISDQKPKLESSNSKTFDQNEDVNVNDMANIIENMSNNSKKYTLNDRKLSNMNPNTKNFPKQPNTTYSDKGIPLSEYLPISTIEEQSKIAAKQEKVKNYTQAQKINVELMGRDILVPEHADDASIRNHQIIDTALNTHEQKWKDKDISSSGKADYPLSSKDRKGKDKCLSGEPDKVLSGLDLKDNKIRRSSEQHKHLSSEDSKGKDKYISGESDKLLSSKDSKGKRKDSKDEENCLSREDSKGKNIYLSNLDLKDKDTLLSGETDKPLSWEDTKDKVNFLSSKTEKLILSGDTKINDKYISGDPDNILASEDSKDKSILLSSEDSKAKDKYLSGEPDTLLSSENSKDTNKLVLGERHKHLSSEGSKGNDKYISGELDNTLPSEDSKDKSILLSSKDSKDKDKYLSDEPDKLLSSKDSKDTNKLVSGEQHKPLSSEDLKSKEKYISDELDKLLSSEDSKDKDKVLSSQDSNGKHIFLTSEDSVDKDKLLLSKDSKYKEKLLSSEDSKSNVIFLSSENSKDKAKLLSSEDLKSKDKYLPDKSDKSLPSEDSKDNNNLVSDEQQKHLSSEDAKSKYKSDEPDKPLSSEDSKVKGHFLSREDPENRDKLLSSEYLKDEKLLRKKDLKDKDFFLSNEESIDNDKLLSSENSKDKDKILSGEPASSVNNTQTEPETTAPIELKDDVTTLELPGAVVATNLKTVSFNLAFHSYLNNKNERIFKTILDENQVYRYPNDSIAVIKTQMKVSSIENLPELNIPLDSMFGMSIKIKSNDQKTDYESDINPDETKTKSFSSFVQGGQSLNTTPERDKMERRVLAQENQNDTVLHRTLTNIYEQELVPLQTMIKALRADIDYLSEQRTLFKKKVLCPKKSLPRNKRLT